MNFCSIGQATLVYLLEYLTLNGPEVLNYKSGKPYWRGRIITVDLLVLTSLDQEKEGVNLLLKSFKRLCPISVKQVSAHNFPYHSWSFYIEKSIFNSNQTVQLIILGRFKVEKVFFNSNQTVQLIILGRFI